MQKSGAHATDRFHRSCAVLIAVGVLSGNALGATKKCPATVKPTESTSLEAQTRRTGCITLLQKHGFSVPDPACTPGSINPTVKLAVLNNKSFTTACVRDKATSAAKKKTAYAAYGLSSPKSNTGSTQTCELDHLVSIELGGADTLDNIWPQCGPPDTQLAQRYFKVKDRVENYLKVQVRAGQMTLAATQKGIAADWTQYIEASEKYWSTHKAKGFGSDKSPSAKRKTP
jgi:hypothetical protein